MKASIHKIAIPSILEVGKGNINNVGTLIKKAMFQKVLICFGEGIEELFGASIRKSLKEAADEALNNNHAKAKVETEDVALTSRDEARKLGITPGKFNLIQKLQELDSNITVEDYKESSVEDIQKKTIELKKIY